MLPSMKRAAALSTPDQPRIGGVKNRASAISRQGHRASASASSSGLGSPSVSAPHHDSVVGGGWKITGAPSSSSTAPSLPSHPPEEGAREEHIVSTFSAVTTYLLYAMLVAFGHMRDFFAQLTGQSRYFGANKAARPKNMAPLLPDADNFFTRRLYHRVQDCFNRPIMGPPSATGMLVVHRSSEDGNKTLQVNEPAAGTKCLNLGSYNYLGFADDWDATCKVAVSGSLRSYPISTCASFAEGGYTSLHSEVERTVAAFVGKPAALIFNMGFATNFLGIPALVGKGCLILSDALNHTSIVAGARASGATIRVFRHNDVEQLSAALRKAVVEGQERTHRPWRKILVMVEGIYSMEGEVCALKDIVAVTKRYKAYLYVDEAHSIGALGKSGRGICEHAGVDPSEIDILMGTFTKSFGAMGGYIAGSVEIVEAIRASSAGFLADNSMSPVVCQQVLTAFRVLMGLDGGDAGATKIQRLKDNSNYFRRELVKMGLEVIGDDDSPIVPMIVYNPAKVAAFSRECLKRGLAVVIVGFPATPILLCRTRFCISAGLSREDLDRALAIVKEVSVICRLRYRLSPFG